MSGRRRIHSQVIGLGRAGLLAAGLLAALLAVVLVARPGPRPMPSPAPAPAGVPTPRQGEPPTLVAGPPPAGTPSPVAPVGDRPIAGQALPTAATAGPAPTEAPATPAAKPTALPTAGPTATRAPRVPPRPSATPRPYDNTASPPPTLSDTTSVLLLGFSSPDAGGPLTDSMLLALYSSSRQTVVLLSVPRDIWAELPFGEPGSVQNKLNAAYAIGVDDTGYRNKPDRYRGQRGGGNLAKDTVARLINHPVQAYAAVHMDTFRQAIDEVGGIDVDVHANFTATAAYGDPRPFRVGREHMDGRRAFVYLWARGTTDNAAETGDMARNRRQRQVLEAFESRLTSPDALLRMPALLRLARAGVETDLPLPALGEIPGLVHRLRGVSFVDVGLNAQNYLGYATGPGGTNILVPVIGAGHWEQVRGFVRTLAADPELGIAMSSQEVKLVDGGGDAVFAEAVRWQLQAAGYRVAPLQSSGAVGETSIRASVRASRLAEDLRARLAEWRVPAALDLEDADIPLTITLGLD